MNKKLSLFALLIVCCFVAKAQNIVQLSFYSPLINTFDMKYTSNHLVVSQNGLLIFDVSNPTVKPKLAAQTTYPGSIAYAVAVQGNYAYMGFGNNGIFAVYDISNFSAPTLKGNLAIPAISFYGVGDIETHGNFAYLSGPDSLYVINISNPASPSRANAIPVEHTQFSGAEDMAIEGNALFIKTPFSVQVYDISNPIFPALISSINYLHTYNKSLVADTINHRVFLSWATALQDFTGYDAYNVSNPSSPSYLFSDSTNFSSGDFGIMDYSYFDDVLFTSKGGSINAFDVSASHHFVTTFTGEDIPNASVSIQVRDSVFFHARGGGIEVLKFTDIVPPVCNPPVTLRSNVAGTTVTLGWNKVQGAKGYVIRYRQANRGWNYVTSKDNIQKLTNLLPNTLYYWEVSTVCNIAERFRSDFSLTERFTTGSSESIISVTPNPVKDVFRINIKDASAKQIIITNYSGNTVMQFQNVRDGQTVSFSNMQQGTYVLQLLNAQNEVIGSTKIFKQ